MLRLNRLTPPLLPLRVVAIFILSAWGWDAVAETFFVAPHGNDANDCSSPAKACASFQRGVDLCPVAHYCSIIAGAGIYTQSTDVQHFKLVVILGPMDERGACTDRGAVKVVEGQVGHHPIFFVQDHSTLGINCMRLEAREPGHCAFMSRQFAIGDVADVDFGAFTSGCGVAASETSKINISNPGISGDASGFAFASDLSQVTIGGLVKMADGLKFDRAFVSSVTGSIVSFYPSGIQGGAHFSGASYQCSNATINKTVVLPGGDVSYLGTDDCTITVKNSLHSKLDAIRSEVNSLRSQLASEITTIRSEVNSLRSQLASEITTIRSEIDDVQHAENVQRRLDRGITAIV